MTIAAGFVAVHVLFMVAVLLMSFIATAGLIRVVLYQIQRTDTLDLLDWFTYEK